MSTITEFPSRMSPAAMLSFSSGIFLIIATLIAVALLNLPKAAGAAVVDAVTVACPMAEVPLDQGYGVSRVALQPVCRTEADQARSNAR